MRGQDEGREQGRGEGRGGEQEECDFMYVARAHRRTDHVIVVLRRHRVELEGSVVVNVGGEEEREGEGKGGLQDRGKRRTTARLFLIGASSEVRTLTETFPELCLRSCESFCLPEEAARMPRSSSAVAGGGMSVWRSTAPVSRKQSGRVR